MLIQLCQNISVLFSFMYIEFGSLQLILEILHFPFKLINLIADCMLLGFLLFSLSHQLKLFISVSRRWIRTLEAIAITKKFQIVLDTILELWNKWVISGEASIDRGLDFINLSWRMVSCLSTKSSNTTRWSELLMKIKRVLPT